jgi:chromatin segregation and condensation protein Rec8/ScpA/Scc1 (kleisin family)
MVCLYLSPTQLRNCNFKMREGTGEEKRGEERGEKRREEREETEEKRDKREGGDREEKDSEGEEEKKDGRSHWGRKIQRGKKRERRRKRTINRETGTLKVAGSETKKTKTKKNILPMYHQLNQSDSVLEHIALFFLQMKRVVLLLPSYKH